MSVIKYNDNFKKILEYGGTQLSSEDIMCSINSHIDVGFNTLSPGISQRSGQDYYGIATFGNISSRKDLTTTGFPVCFTSPPALYVSVMGDSKFVQLMRVGTVLSENAGPSSITVWNHTKTKLPKGLDVRIIAIGECAGSRKFGAQVITEGLQYLGKDQVDNVPINEFVINTYNSYVEAGDGNKQGLDAQWCSEFACVCDRIAGIPKEIAPMFASAYKGSRKYSEQGRWYKRDGSGFRQATVVDGHPETWQDKFISKKIVMPQVGDLLWTCNKSHPHTPWHTARVTSVDGTKIYTIEGNLGGKVERRCRDISKTNGLGQWVYAFGSVDYESLTEVK